MTTNINRVELFLKVDEKPKTPIILSSKSLISIEPSTHRTLKKLKLIKLFNTGKKRIIISEDVEC